MSANIMFDTSDCKPEYTSLRLATSPPRQGVDSSRSSSNDNEESVLAGDEDLVDLCNEAELVHTQEKRETVVDVFLEEYRASLNALFGREPSPTPSATAPAADVGDHASTVDTASALAPELVGTVSSFVLEPVGIASAPERSSACAMSTPCSPPPPTAPPPLAPSPPPPPAAPPPSAPPSPSNVRYFSP